MYYQRLSMFCLCCYHYNNFYCFVLVCFVIYKHVYITHFSSSCIFKNSLFSSIICFKFYLDFVGILETGFRFVGTFWVFQYFSTLTYGVYHVFLEWWVWIPNQIIITIQSLKLVNIRYLSHTFYMLPYIKTF